MLQKLKRNHTTGTKQENTMGVRTSKGYISSARIRKNLDHRGKPLRGMGGPSNTKPKRKYYAPGGKGKQSSMLSDKTFGKPPKSGSAKLKP